ncbi:MAG: NAD(P)-binding domain-containing protein [Solirubrobacterales bacterium]|nr:NAD(P)-binding domain-containing protein [Solirubrobacterales bacterium]
MSTIGVIGAGHIGRNFSIAAIRAGHEIVISHSRAPEALADLVSELGPRARAATAAEAAAVGDFALVAIPLTGTAGVPVEPLAGKIVLTTNNYFGKRDGPIAAIDSGELTVPAYLQAHLPTSKVVRAFNHIDAAQIVSDGTPNGTPNRRALGYAGDAPDAKQVASDLYEAFGFDAVDVGGLADAWRLDVDQPTFVVRQTRDELVANLARAQRHLPQLQSQGA